MIEIIRAGPLTTLQDLGRPGHAHLGVGRSGAVDRPALRLANRLVGNPESAAALEITLGGLAARFTAAATIALTGAPCRVHMGHRGGGAMYGPMAVLPGQVIELDPPEYGLRTYLAARGGFAVEPVLGSRSTDTLAGLGPPGVTSGMRLPIGRTASELPVVDVAPVARPPRELVLRALLGPRDDWFTEGARTTLGSSFYEVTAESDRVGIRLRGRALERSHTGELPSEGMVDGALQVTPDGMPVLFLADHPVTGGYPVIAVVDDGDLPLAAQARPGERLRFDLARSPND